MKLSVVCYNIWFDKTRIVERLESLCASLMVLDADVVALQEVLPDAYGLIKKQISSIYPYWAPTELHTRGYRTVIFSKYKIAKAIKKPFSNSSMGRDLLYIVINVPIPVVDEEGVSVEKRPTIVATSHFESVFKESAPIKHKQYQEAENILDTIADKEKANVILCCDANATKEDDPHFFPTKEWTDVWTQLGNSKNKFTYDFINNEYIAPAKYRSRLDRIVYKGNLTATEFSMHMGVEGFVTPSDHHGLYAQFTLE